ncbi:putative aminotransferase [Toxoplasma gondii TgCatPRC2]|uniref:Aminotransferase, putative n=14 Tax=Toxoplasma gondii TaxID=5811 RepID=B9PWE5_TOXGV|nr:aminotransferase, putative [Toxoplasma gondii ME49]EPR61876.1 putative aminotransferase [Toxoplasma gondii GT1]ESS30874.1 putative aminotransferase [Toxoplasma gondii VEG]KFG37460.1 putative aminotransferase [Toxoplasma gondii p89]KFG37569.1 putative aminotransferase [Toxoplasma gondii FOU]KFG45984.1 putative aminotransferase [Toxoplasma gondii GAB2-2007-GAL-DOM2]KFG58065.1 putative aminotransferase [Toxoplasma gondii RUB]KFG99665.1 putative aminotransferase [Toxoplasma gondii VAND]KFH07|eukprot:XP_002368884.1 aminotransferase, putative [Toxoplasma gondii ME49]
MSGDHRNGSGASESCTRKKIRYMQTKGPPASEQVNLRLGYPAPLELPIKGLRKATAAKMAEDDPEFFMYGVPEGFLEFRESLASFLSEEYGFPVSSDELMAVNGSSGALDLICKVYTQGGDVVFTENPTYFLAYPTFRDYDLKPIEVPMDQDGVNIEAFEELLLKYKPKLFYTIPVAHNPTGRTTSSEKRKRIVELAVKHNFKVVADEVYQLLCFEGVDIPPPFAAFDHNNEHCVISIGSFSKILAPALRLGWLQAHPSLLKPILACGMIESGGCLNPLICGFVQKTIDMGILKENVVATRRALFGRCDRLRASLRKYMPKEASFEEPIGGYFLIVKLPEGIKSLDLLEEANKNHKVSFLPGTSFGKGFDDYIRLSFSYYCGDDLETGVKRIADALNVLMKKQGNAATEEA